MTSRGLRLLAYGRVSDVKGRSGESFISPEDQMSKCRSYAETYEHEILEEALDLDVSGGVMERPELDRFIAKIKSGEAQGLIVAKLDRFSRSSRGALNALKEIEDAGGVLISVQEQIDSTTAAGRFVRAIFLATAEWERERIGESWNTAQKSAVARGVHISRHVPPGYQRGAGGRLEPHPKYGKVIAKAYELAASGTTPSDIARYLTEQGLPSGDNEHAIWQGPRVTRLLKNRVYLGQARYGELVNDDAHKPLTDLETWLLAQRRKHGPSPSPDSTYLLSGLVRCASCRYSMRPQRGSGKGKRKVASYRCQTDSAAGKCECPSVIVMERLDRYVIDQFLARTFSESYKPKVEQHDSDARAALEDARRALAEVEALKGELRPAAYAQALDSALADLEAAERELTKIGTYTEQDVALLANAALPLLNSDYQLDEEGTKIVRAALARDIAAVFVRPAKSKSKNLPISDRVKIVWQGEEELELPRRATSGFKPTPYTWEEAA